MSLGHGFTHIKFPGRAGELAREKATASLARELGDNYTTYHQYLRAEFERTGGPPDPDDYRGDFEGYAERWARIQEIVSAEVLLRRAYLHRTRGSRLTDFPHVGPPVLDEQHRMVAFVDGD